jgi:uncharacterized membrane protein YccC
MRCGFPSYACYSARAMLASAVAAYKSELRLVARALTAAVLSYLIAETLTLPQSYWAVLTALIVVQGSLGGTLAAGVDRVLGTVAGAALGFAAALTRRFLDVPEVVLLVLAVAPVALLAALRPSFRLAPVTAAIVLLGSSGAVSPLASALYRIGEISLGTLVGIAVSILVLPSRAREICFERAGELLDLLAQLLVLHLLPPDAAGRETVDRLNERIRNGLGKVAVAAQEARREHATFMADGPVPDRLLRGLRRLRIDVVFVSRATAASGFDWQRLGPVLGDVASGFRAALETLAATLRPEHQAPHRGRADLDLTELDETIAKLSNAIDAGADDPAASRDNGVLSFVIETLRRDLGDIADALAPPPTR